MRGERFAGKYIESIVASGGRHIEIYRVFEHIRVVETETDDDGPLKAFEVRGRAVEDFAAETSLHSHHIKWTQACSEFPIGKCVPVKLKPTWIDDSYVLGVCSFLK